MNKLNVTLQNNWISPSQSKTLWGDLFRLPWQEESIKIYGRMVKVPRKVLWIADEGIVYHYSGLDHHPHPWTSFLMDIREKLIDHLKTPFNAVLANYYKNGLDYMGPHSDNEKELGPNPVVASISFGSSRRFLFHHKQTHEKHEFLLESGSLLIMGSGVQEYWYHSLPKMRRVQDPRINLTFRYVQPNLRIS